MTATATLAQLLLDALPQTQCTRCGYPDCKAYAEAMASGEAAINQCPPGGSEGIVRLATITGREPMPLNPANGTEGPLRLAVIDEDWCIGCTLCMKACPVDCIAMIDATPGRTGWDAWTPAQAAQARERYDFHQWRTERDAAEHAERLAAKARDALADIAGTSQLTDPDDLQAKRGVIQAALDRMRRRKAGP